METIVVKAEKRLELGKGASSRLRRQRLVPAIIYGEKMKNLPVAIPESELRRFPLGTGTVFNIEVAGDRQHNVLVRELQKDLLTQKVIHLDLLKVSMTEKLVTTVPIKVVGEAKGVKEGGLLQYGIREVEIESLPGDIPPAITVDVSPMEIGDNIKVEDLAAPTGVAILTEPEKIVASVVAPQNEVIEEDVETGENELQSDAEKDVSQ